MLKIRLHHKRYFMSDPESTYVRAGLNEVKGSFDIDEIRRIELNKVIKQFTFVFTSWWILF